MNSFEKVLVGGMPMLLGNPLSEIESISCLGLEVDTKVNQVGRYSANGKETSSSRVRKITPYMTYKGIFRHDGEEYMTFLLPSDGVTGWNLFKPQKPVYSLWQINKYEDKEPELLVFDYNYSALYIYKAEFKIFENE